MSRTLLRILLVSLLTACVMVPLTASASSITYTEVFMASGTVNGTPFDGTVTFTFVSDTNLIMQQGQLFRTPNGVAGVSIQGIGAGTLNDPFWVFDNQGNGVAGFSDANIEDIVDLSNPAFFTYNLKSPIGPLNSTYFFTDNGVMLGSSLGTITLSSFSGTPTFQASQGGTTPEPGSLVLFGTGVVGLAAAFRRKFRM